MLKRFVIVAALSFPMTAFAQERTFTIDGGQVSVPIGLTVQVKAVSVSGDATTVRLLASFDSHVTNSVNMNDQENAYIAWGEGEQERLHLRQIADNKWMRIGNGQTMEGDLVFPGTIPAGVSKVTLVFNPGRNGDDSSAPGVTIPLELTP